jgi:hypothetical protein
MAMALIREELLRHCWAGHPLRKLCSLLMLMAGFCLFGCGKKEAAPASKPDQASGNPLTAPVDYLGAAAKAKQKAEQTVDAVGLNQAIQLFYAQEGRFPKDLNELVGPNYLRRLPSPPPGMKFDYNPTNGQLKFVPQ